MTWYGENNSLDYSKPIVATVSTGEYLLLPICYPERYKVSHYDWFSISTGEYNSCCNFKTPKEAVDAYGEENCRNVEITFK